MYAIQPSGHTSIAQAGGSQGPSSYLCLALFVLMCVNPLFGLIAAICSCSSRHIAAVDWDGARMRGKISMWFSITGIVTTVIGALVFVLIFYTKDS